MYGIIYKTTCLINGKIYIGQTCLKRKSYLGSGTNMQRAIRKYGKANFVRETLRECKSQAELDAAEGYWIKKLDATNPDVGYNILPGTANGFGRINPTKLPEVRKKISESKIGKMSGSKNPAFGSKHPHTEEWKKEHSLKMKGRKHSEETKRKISVSQIGEKNHMYGKEVSNETKQKLSKAFSGCNNPMYGVRIIGVDHPLYGCRFQWITDGQINKRLKHNEEMPKGWKLGYTRRKI